MKVYRFSFFVILFVLLTLISCAHHQKLPEETIHTIYAVNHGDDSPLHRYAPLFLTYDHQSEYNRIGRASAMYDDQGDEHIFVDSQHPTIYHLTRRFTTKKKSYTNFIYRVHFPKIPFSLIPFNLTAGRNIGLIVVITIDSQQKPVLVTTVHTCGCYLAIVPTSYLPREALPLNWKRMSIKVYGEKLPGNLDYSKANHTKLLIHLRPEVHRVMNLEIVAKQDVQGPGNINVMEMALAPMERLEAIPLGDGTTSFYHQDGILKGHVKGSVKPLESMLLSLPSLDFFVGTDKIFGNRKKTGNPFYTSLKPWNRKASDMWNFAEFLEFWGWRL
ncbi:MAG: hypothetical protein JSW04_14535 [Desulfobacterales bacterium]|nr:MAG: hypothetical protein JSW04_14535 [Desulfobacterales bacterium]